MRTGDEDWENVKGFELTIGHWTRRDGGTDGRRAHLSRPSFLSAYTTHV